MDSDNLVRCLLVEESDGKTTLGIRELPRHRFGSDSVAISINYSSLNYKDTLACQGHRGIIRSLPHVPGIDLAGTVIESSDVKYRVGDRVVVTGYDLGQGHWGGWSQYARVPADWIVPLPDGLTLHEAMFIGTAGFTAAQGLAALQRNGVQPNCGPVVVTGATGGVGSLAVRLLAQVGYEVVAVTGKLECEAALKSIGAHQVVSRETLAINDNRPMHSAKWAGAIDTVGGPILTSLLKSIQYGGCVAACGLVAGHQLDLTVYPFLLRGISLCGIASADCPMHARLELWKKLSSVWKPARSDVLCCEVRLEQLPSLVEKMSKGQIQGRVVVNCQ